jgi:hypothetical protein
MDRPYDVRIKADRVALADLLPTIDTHTFAIDRDTFIGALETVGQHLNNPEWLIYRWGVFYPIPSGAFSSGFSLDQMVEFGIYLKNANRFDNFKMVLKGFFNPPQFLDSLFEVKVAYLFSTRPSFIDLRFAPEYMVRGLLKRPEFEITTTNGRYCVECKRPHIHAQLAFKSLQAVSKAFNSKMTEANWPADLRLEVEIVTPLRGRVSDFAFRIVKSGIESGPVVDSIAIGSFKAYVVRRPDPFRLPSAPWHTDTMIVGDTPTGILNPAVTSLRVANYKLDSKFETSIGKRVREALKQLPESEKCIIVIGDTSPRIALPICQKRIDDPAYSHINVFAVYRDENPTLIFRDKDINMIRDLFGNSTVN